MNEDGKHKFLSSYPKIYKLLLDSQAEPFTLQMTTYRFGTDPQDMNVGPSRNGYRDKVQVQAPRDMEQ